MVEARTWTDKGSLFKPSRITTYAWCHVTLGKPVASRANNNRCTYGSQRCAAICHALGIAMMAEATLSELLHSAAI